MCAARLLHRAKRWDLLACTGAVAGAVAYVQTHRPHTHFDSPASSTWPQETTAIPRGYGGRSKGGKPSVGAAKPATAERQSPDPATYSPGFEHDDESAWETFSLMLSSASDSITQIKWTGLGDKITDLILPAWARQLPGALAKLQSELTMEDGSLADIIWQEAQNPDINPEIFWDADVRVSDDLCREEKAFRRKRKQHVTLALAKYLDLPEHEVHPDDVPTIAMCGSGGGLRALVAGASSYLSAQEAGLFDCVTYTAGVSGSCWLQTLYYSSLGNGNHGRILDHLKSRLGIHLAFPPTALKLITSAPTNKFLLSGFIEKLKGNPHADFGLVDLYGGLLAARLLVPKGDLGVDDRDLKLSNQRRYTNTGMYPMPIYAVVRHEIPVEDIIAEADRDNESIQQKVKETARKESWFQWFEFSPYECFCEEFGAGIPTYSLGRRFINGQSQVLETWTSLPEIRQPLLLGIYGSAFCATLSHYYKELHPVLSGLAGFAGIDGMLQEKKDDLMKIHPIDPGSIPNFVYGMRGLPATCPDSVLRSEHLQLMDGGMANNLPIYPLLRPGRDVDVLIAFDASADIQRENWLSAVDGYAKQRGVKGWPMGSGWPKDTSKTEENNAQAVEEAQATISRDAAVQVAAAEEKQREGKLKSTTQESLGYCSVWVGSKQERVSDSPPPPSKRLTWEDDVDSTFQLMQPNAGLAVIYFPLLPNDQVPGLHPDHTDFMSTWNFVYTPSQIDQVAALAKANFEAGREQTKATIRAVYERKKQLRLAKILAANDAPRPEFSIAS